MSIEGNTESDCEYFSGSYDKWYNVLLELLDQPIDEYLPNEAEDANKNVVDQDAVVMNHEIDYLKEVSSDNGESNSHKEGPFVDKY